MRQSVACFSHSNAKQQPNRSYFKSKKADGTHRRLCGLRISAWIFCHGRNPPPFQQYVRCAMGIIAMEYEKKKKIIKKSKIEIAAPRNEKRDRDREGERERDDIHSNQSHIYLFNFSCARSSFSVFGRFVHLLCCRRLSLFVLAAMLHALTQCRWSERRQ